MRINILVEGESEETFVNELLKEPLSYQKLYLKVQCVITSRDKRSGTAYKGGLSNYAKVKNHLLRWTKEDQNDDVRFSTMFDLFRLPNDFPGFANAKNNQDKYQQVALLESAFSDDIKDHRLIPYIQLHEFEALLLSDPSKFDSYFIQKKTQVNELSQCAKSFESPELVNDELPPSKLIGKIFPNYPKVKVAASSTIAEAIGLAKIRQSCRHFNQWLSQLESLA
jgi:hypothetical protein